MRSASFPSNHGLNNVLCFVPLCEPFLYFSERPSLEQLRLLEGIIVGIIIGVFTILALLFPVLLPLWTEITSSKDMAEATCSKPPAIARASTLATSFTPSKSTPLHALLVRGLPPDGRPSAPHRQWNERRVFQLRHEPKFHLPDGVHATLIVGSNASSDLEHWRRQNDELQSRIVELEAQLQ
ncbi:hypothetical protein C8F04DRAFT_72135 [Mycena alexandri]|uniref:Uncharacterized protein n=1 Tax=Mycena alexandri TaxID=1745969 RepID=A0AAD6SKP9_9AGAR|nr:hypothetical protein C8F04DRAFT_72135 [Mycena alexandri]